MGSPRVAWVGDWLLLLACSAGVFWWGESCLFICSYRCNRHFWCYDGGRLGRVKIVQFSSLFSSFNMALSWAKHSRPEDHSTRDSASVSCYSSFEIINICNALAISPVHCLHKQPIWKRTERFFIPAVRFCFATERLVPPPGTGHVYLTLPSSLDFISGQNVSGHVV